MKFKYYDMVKILSGFYGGQEGRCIGMKYLNAIETEERYTLQLNKNNLVIQENAKNLTFVSYN